MRSMDGLLSRFTPGVAAALSGKLVLVEEKLITADTTSTDFSGLDGDTHKVYVIQGRLITPLAISDFVLNPNAVTTNQLCASQVIPGPAAGPATTTGLLIHQSGVAEYRTIAFEGVLWAARILANGTVRERMWSCRSAGQRNDPSTAIGGYDSIGCWDETATNVTSLRVRSTDATQILAGSWLALYRVTP